MMHLLILFLLAIAPAPATEDAVADRTLAERTATLFEDWDRTDSPGAAVAVYRDGAIAFARGFGMANLELGVRIAPHSVFDIGSTSKQFTAFSVLLLAEDGKLSLDDDVRKYVPELADTGRTVTIRHLLHHTSGMRDYIALFTLKGAREADHVTDGETIAMLSRQRDLNFEPGTEHLYCNTGYYLLAVVVQRASGTSLRTFARQRIFEPLGMRHTQFNDDHARVIENRATGYAPAENGGFSIAMSDWEQVGDGGVLTSVEDLLLWDRNFYEPRVGGAALLRQMQTPGRLNDGTALDYACGLVVGQYRGLRIVEHGGAWAGYRAQLLRFPEQRTSIAVLCNLGTMDPNALALRVADVWLEGVLAPPAAFAEPVAAAPSPPAELAVVVPEAELALLAGRYRGPSEMVEVRLEGGVLHLRGATFRESTLVPLGGGRFRRDGGRLPTMVRFEPPAGGGLGVLELQVEGRQKLTLPRIEDWRPSAEELAAFAGEYHCAEIDATMALHASAAGLALEQRIFGVHEAIPLARDEFTGEFGDIRIVRGANGAVEGFMLDAGRVRNLRFERVR